DVFTLAHEMGHAMHSYYTNKTQPPVYRDYKIFVAEVASTVNENLLLEYLLRDAKEERRAYLLGRKAEAIRTTFYRQAMFAEFEKKAHEMYAGGEALTAENLCTVYGKINKKYYGSVCVCDENISYEWARIPHFYTSFYVYQYATGFAAATGIKELVLKNTSEAERYIGFLNGGNSDYPLSLLKQAGVDLTSSEAAKSVIRDLASATEELACLLDK
ncbi:MAG: oligoendopeptidase F, partial [Oscillospiraceae bacterium]|nr:oligoendopeptidase F [Oscillospiraceae bacterium]